MVWINDQELTVTPVTGFRKATSGKGWIVQGSDFDCFLWSSDKLLKQLLVALATWVDSGQGKVLEITKDSKEKRGFTILPAIQKKQPIPCQYRLTEVGYEVITDGDTEETNPFL